MPHLTVLVGLPATGKSTYREKMLLETPDGELGIVSSDDIIEELSKEKGMTYSEGFPHFIGPASRLVAVKAEMFRDAEIDVVWDQTNLTRKSRSRILRLFEGTSYKKTAIVFPQPNEEEHRKRLLSREGKSIPWEVVEEMKQKYEEPRLFAEGFDAVLHLSVND